MLGVPMRFVRLAGCSVGCKECDTDYSVAERLSIGEIVERLDRLPRANWVWITGGEPTDHDCCQLIVALRQELYNVAMATAGTKQVPPGIDFLSVSPHTLDKAWTQRSGTQLNIVPGLNGLRLSELPVNTFDYRYVTPCDGKPETLNECLQWVKSHPSWRLGIQAHKVWGLA